MPQRKKKARKYIFVVGGVISGVGKGIAAASIGKILQSRGLAVTAVKIDPYVNVDAGTMNPTEHGETFVLDDGMECDQDMGNYERFLGADLTRANYMTTGSIYKSVIDRERMMGYGGRCVSVVPHIPMEVVDRIDRAAEKAKAEVIIVEIGGTAGEYENILFLEAVRMLKIRHPGDVLLALVSYLPSVGDGEPKTKPTQHAVRDLNAAGLQPDVILARAENPLDQKRKEKIAFHCNVEERCVISAPNVESIYEVPVNLEKDGVGDLIIEKLGLRPGNKDLKEWRSLVGRIKHPKGVVRIGMVGKYFATGNFVLADSYISVIEAVKHAAYGAGQKPVLEWINAEEFEKNPAAVAVLKKYDGIVVPGGFGARGVEGIIMAIRFCREKKIPYFGLCYGMQLAIVEFARDVVGLKKAHTTEIEKEAAHPVIDVMPEQKGNIVAKNYGGSMRLGAYPAALKDKTTALAAYKSHLISERHRHRYEVNPEYIERLEAKGLVFSGTSPDRRLMEIMELPRSIHPFFLGTQFHPELKSRPLSPHPLFREFIAVAVKNQKTTSRKR